MKSSAHLKVNWQVDEIISSLVIFINSGQKHLRSIPGIPLRQQEHKNMSLLQTERHLHINKL